MKAGVLFLAATLSLPVLAQTQAPVKTQPEAMAWLQRIYSASSKLNYTGIFLYQRGSDLIETSRITHLADASGVYEKLEKLDGFPREVIRENNEIRFYSPQVKLVRVENRKTWTSFPNVLPANLAGLQDYYNIRKGERERIAGFEAQAIILEPRDAMRYGHKLWADVDSGLLLKSLLFNERNETVEQFTFTQLNTRIAFDREAVKCKWADVAASWVWESPKMSDTNFEDSGWQFRSGQGFRKISEMKRSMPNKSMEVGHIVLSDGLSAVSVFIEPLTEAMLKLHQGLSSQGAINVYTKRIANHIVTVLGEAPAASIVQIGNSIEYRKP